MKKPKKNVKASVQLKEYIVTARVRMAFQGACVLHHGRGSTDLGTIIVPIMQNG